MSQFSFIIFVLFYLHVFFIFAQYELSLVAHDGVNESETTVGIRVNDVNDLPPVFLQKSYNATIHEETIHTLRPILKVGGYKMFEATSTKKYFRG